MKSPESIRSHPQQIEAGSIDLRKLLFLFPSCIITSFIELKSLFDTKQKSVDRRVSSPPLPTLLWPWSSITGKLKKSLQEKCKKPSGACSQAFWAPNRSPAPGGEHNPCTNTPRNTLVTESANLLCSRCTNTRAFTPPTSPLGKQIRELAAALCIRRICAANEANVCGITSAETCYDRCFSS